MNIHNLKVGDKGFMRRRSDRMPQWVEFTVNESYLPLISEFPEEYKKIVSYEDALKLRILNFEEITHHWYRPTDKKLFHHQDGFSTNSSKMRISAPEYTVMLKWLRHSCENKSLAETLFIFTK